MRVPVFPRRPLPGWTPRTGPPEDPPLAASAFLQGEAFPLEPNARFQPIHPIHQALSDESTAKEEFRHGNRRKSKAETAKCLTASASRSTRALPRWKSQADVRTR